MKKYYIGTSGWNYSHWKEKFYPKDIAQNKWFEYYSKHFDTIEINYSFYNWPSEKVLKNWYLRAPKKFKFTLKAPRSITHLKRFLNVEDKVNYFYNLSSLLKEKLGCYLFQAPPSFRNNALNKQRIEKFLQALDKKKDNAIEFRHKSWWKKDVREMLKQHETAFTTVSGLGMPPEIITGKLSYFRLHGKRYDTKYTGRQLQKYAKKLLECKKAYAYFNNDKDAYAVENAKQLQNMI